METQTTEAKRILEEYRKQLLLLQEHGPFRDVKSLTKLVGKTILLTGIGDPRVDNLEDRIFSFKIGSLDTCVLREERSKNLDWCIYRFFLDRSQAPLEYFLEGGSIPFKSETFEIEIYKSLNEWSCQPMSHWKSDADKVCRHIKCIVIDETK